MADNPFVPEAFSARPFWLAVLGRWLSLLKEYEGVDPSDKDLAYWYGERPLTGLLGAAAWQLGGWSLEEFGAGRWKKRSGETRLGRGDLWLGCTRGDATGAATVEAKILWAYQNSLDAVKTALDDQLNRARKQLRQIESADRVGEPFAVCYVVPCFAGSKSKQRGERLLTWLAGQTRQEGMADATHLATIGNITDVDDKERPTYPGVLLVARQEQWRDK
jgi:hypothetical protein